MSATAVSRPQPAAGLPLVAPILAFARTPKGSLTVLFLALLALLGTALGWQPMLPHLASAVAGACFTEIIIVCLARGAWRWPSSAWLSGLIVAFVLGTETPWAITFALGALATVSKHLLRTRRGHIFNPAALALLVSIPLFGTAQSWWGGLPDLPALWLLALLAAGAWLVDRLNKFPLVLAYLGTYFGLFAVAALANPAGVAEMFRAPFVHAALFLALFMLTDPPTSPGRYAEQIAIGVLAAAVSCVAQLAGAGQAYLLLGLLAGNAALAAWRWLNGRKVSHRAAPAALRPTRNGTHARDATSPSDMEATTAA